MNRPNFLFVVRDLSDYRPETVSLLKREFKRFQEAAWVYVAEENRTEITDKNDVRYLPWHADLLESFGQLSLVVVADNPMLYYKLRHRNSRAEHIAVFSESTFEHCGTLYWIDTILKSRKQIPEADPVPASRETNRLVA